MKYLVISAVCPDHGERVLTPLATAETIEEAVQEAKDFAEGLTDDALVFVVPSIFTVAGEVPIE